MYNMIMPMFVRYGLPVIYSIISTLIAAFVVTGLLWGLASEESKVQFFTKYNDGDVSFLFLLVCVCFVGVFAELLGYFGKLLVKVIKK